MAYLVLARKYRPQTFAEVVGQAAIARTLENAIRLDRVAHAYLFAGPRGVGKTSLARILARALNCEKGPTPEPCGACERCLAIRKGADLDIVEIDAASNRGIDDIRQLRDKARVAPMMGRLKLYIVDEVHQLTSEAFNALLKTLEEPPRHVVFVLATTEPERIPDTIRSRCQIFEFKRVRDAEIAARLGVVLEREGIACESAALDLIARAARGGMRDALSLLDQVITHGAGKVALASAAAVTGALSHDAVRSLFSAVAGGDAGAVLSELERLDEAGVAAESVLDAMIDEARAAVAAAATSRDAGADLDRSLAVSNVLLAARRRLRDHDDPRFPLEIALLKAGRVSTALPLAEAIAALEGARAGVPVSPASPAPPARAAAPAASAPAPTGIAEQYQSLVREVQTRAGSVGAFLDAWRPVRFDGRNLELARKKPGPAIYTLTEPKVRALLDEVTPRIFGRPIALVEVADPSPAAEAGAGGRAGGPPGIERALEMFDGKVVD